DLSLRNHTASISLRPSSRTTHDASRSIAFCLVRPNRPFLGIASQPRPMRTFVSSPPPDFSSEMRWPFAMLTDMVFLLRVVLGEQEPERLAGNLLGRAEISGASDADALGDGVRLHELGVARAPGDVRGGEQFGVEQRVAGGEHGARSQ